MSDSDRWQQDVGVSNDASKLRKVWLYANVEQSSDYQWEDSGGHVIRPTIQNGNCDKSCI